ncbi:subtilase family protein [Rarobacter incanus]|uniref:Subtilase family protein n=1 Tax=Rarobacter incanus TaxID=153494 RepID=A0A542SPY7_9MICO|nr:subtilase family protein [Rarobacter incanus]
MERVFGRVCALAMAALLTVSAMTQPAAAAGRDAAASADPTARQAGSSQQADVAAHVASDVALDASGSARVIVTFAGSGSTATQRAAGVVSSKAAVARGRAAVLAKLSTADYRVARTYARIPAVSLRVNEAALDDLREDPNVTAVQMDRVVRATMLESNAVTGITQVQGSYGYTGKGVSVAIIDTGIASDTGSVHPDLADDVVEQLCFREDNDCPTGPNVAADDADFHGTHVAGIITGGNGAAPDAKIYPIKVLSDGSGYDSDILAAVDWIVNKNASAPGSVNLVNMSLGGDTYANRAACNADNQAYKTAFADLRAQGAAIFAATGNDANTNGVSAPGCVDGAIGVGATYDAAMNVSFANCRDAHAVVDMVGCFSNTTATRGTGELVDLLAPGCAIASDGAGGATTDVKCGTSMATPNAAAIGAVVLEAAADAGVTLSADELEQVLEQSGKPVTDTRLSGTIQFPRVDALAAVRSLAIGAPTGLVAAATPSNVSLQWGAVTGADHYVLERTGAAGTTRWEVEAASFIDEGPGCGALAYRVAAVSAGGVVSEWTQQVGATARACPAAVSGFSAASGGERVVLLTWDLPAAAGLTIQRKTGDEAAFTDIVHFAATDRALPTSYRDDLGDEQAGCASITYRIVSTNSSGDAAISADQVRNMCQPWNETRATATAIGNLPYSATSEHAELAARSGAIAFPAGCLAATEQSRVTTSLWWSFGAIASQAVDVTADTMAGSWSDHVLSVWKVAGAELVNVGCAAGSAAKPAATDAVLLESGSTYLIRIDRIDGAGVNDAGTAGVRVAVSAPDDPGTSEPGDGDGGGGGGVSLPGDGDGDGGVSLPGEGDGDGGGSVPGDGDGGGSLPGAGDGGGSDPVDGGSAGGTDPIPTPGTDPGASTGGEGAGGNGASGSTGGDSSATPRGGTSPVVNPAGTRVIADLAIKGRGAQVGRYYIGSAAKQTKTQRAGKTTKITLTVWNRGAASSRIKLTGTKTPRGYKVVYRTASGRNITSKVTRGTFATKVLEPGGSAKILVTLKRVKPKKVKKKSVVTFAAVPQNGSGTADRVRIVLRR